MAHSYHVNLRWEADRKGIISSPELETAIQVATPSEFPKGVPNIWSPEHLFTAAINSCFMTTFLAIAENSKLEFTEFSCSAEGLLEQVEGKYVMTEVILRPSLRIPSSVDPTRAERVLQKSESACLITNSVRAKVSMVPEIKI
jgi:peroxiredoxin-like protein